MDVSLAMRTAVSGSRPPFPLPAIAASTFLAASMYFFPRFLGIQNLKPHRTGCALDHLHRRLGVVGVEVLPLRLDDLAQLLTGDPADLLAVRLGRSLLDSRGSLE